MSKRMRGEEAAPGPLAMRKVVINVQFGGFRIARGYGPYMCDHKVCDRECRLHPDLIAAIERDGTKAVSGMYSKLQIVTVPADLDFQINEYDGGESLHNYVPKRGLDAETTARLLEWIRDEYGYE